MTKNSSTQLADNVAAALRTPTDLSRDGVNEISSSLRHLLADVFALYVKTQNFHWHMSGRISVTITCSWTTKANRFSL